MTPHDIVTALRLRELPTEGGLFGQSWRDESCSAIYYLLVAPDFSALHRLDRLEIYSFHAGAPAQMLLLTEDGQISEPILGPDVLADHRPQIVVPAGTWQASHPLGAWTLMGTVVVPPYTDDCIEFADARALATRYPAHAERITPLCR